MATMCKPSYRANSGCRPKTATAIVAAVGNGAELKNARHMAAWLGLVPRQHSSGDQQIMVRLSKRGNQYRGSKN